jgi:phenylalanyl-tRNA synthetase alpha chain
LKAELAQLREAAVAEIGAAASEEAVEAIRLQYLGRKGSLNAILRGLGQLDPAERPAMGALANDVKAAITGALDGKAATLGEAALARALAEDRFDVTLPGRRRPRGHVHPLRQTEDDIVDIFVAMGFRVADGPEIESDDLNFGALNFPPDHPARDAQDTLFVDAGPGLLLRTHTSPVQIRVMRSTPPPLRIVAPGTVYRRDELDPTHSPMFQQIEVFMVDERVTFADLKGVLREFAQRLFGESTAVRFRSSFFPFTEPSAEVDVSCVRCPGAPAAPDASCRVCKGSGWLEILGAGMIHPNVLRAGGYDPEVVRGFAFGLGVERVAQLRYGLDDLRLFYDNDLRFLEQF